MYGLNLSRRYSFFALLPLILCFFLTTPETSAQRVALKTNALEYVVLTPNFTVETRLSRTLSLQLGLSLNPITKEIADMKFTNYRVEPELRYWFNRPMAKHFVALSFTAATYSIRLKDRFWEGDLVGGGISYGYALVLSKHWNMEAELGVGLASIYGYKYRGINNKPYKKNLDKLMPVPIRCALSFSYIFK